MERKLELNLAFARAVKLATNYELDSHYTLYTLTVTDFVLQVSKIFAR